MDQSLVENLGLGHRFVQGAVPDERPYGKLRAGSVRFECLLSDTLLDSET